MFVQNGYLALLQTITKLGELQDVPIEFVNKGLELNLKFKPEDTFLYDSLPGEQAD
jgi:hypothetical protein